MTTDASAACRHRGETSPLFRRVDAAIGLAAGILAACCALAMLAGAWWAGPTAAPPTTAITMTLGTTPIEVPGAWLRTPEPVPGQRIERLDLRVSLKDLAGRRGFRADLDEDAVLFVTLLVPDGSMAPADRPTQLYARFLSADVTRVEGGLMRRPFRPGTPYEGEELVLVPPDGRSFAARCLAGAPSGEAGATCLTELRLPHMDVQVRFAPPLLERWSTLVGAIRGRFDTPSP